jgi:DNA-binding winged helix-turn-helix (wHTH) protein
VDFRILGRLEVVENGVDVAPRRAQPRVVLAMLLLHPNDVLTTDRLIEALWGDSAPPTADKALQGHVSILRKALGFERLVTERGGYRLAVQPGELDADRFTSEVVAARGLPDPAPPLEALHRGESGDPCRVGRCTRGGNVALRRGAEGLASYGWPFEEAHAQLGAARCLEALGQDQAARAPLTRASGLAGALGAAPMREAISRLEAMLQTTGAPA